MKFHQIPGEMKQYVAWIVWRYVDNGNEKLDKEPFDAKTGYHASVKNPATWSTFDQALAVFNAGGYSGIGFVLSKNDPFAFIDLDDTKGDQVALDRQKKVYDNFNSYSEVSPSGKGLHIIIKGSVPAGRRRAFMEVYSEDRYMTMTGDVYRDAPIVERQELLSLLFDQMGGEKNQPIHDGLSPQTQDDATIISTAMGAQNGTKFKALHEGAWQQFYQSQSEADFSYIDMLAFYTQNRDQITRMFRASSLGQRDKAKRENYVNRMIDRSFDRMLPPINYDNYEQAAMNFEQTEKKAAETPAAKLIEGNAANEGEAAQVLLPGIEPQSKPTHLDNLPPGMLGEIAQFIYSSSPRPVREIAIAAAIGLMAGMCGRSYNINGTGLNQYILILAPTGSGKEGAASGISRLLEELQKFHGAIHDFMGPSSIASGRALIKHLSKSSKCFVSIVGEFGLFIKQMSAHNANPAQIALRRVLLDLYHKSGKGESIAASIYADSDKNVGRIANPAFSMLGESTPEKFYENLDENMVTEGFLPRFTIIEYDGIRQPLNENASKIAPPFDLIDHLKALATHCLGAQHGNLIKDVAMSEEAKAFMRDFDKFADHQINAASAEVIRHLWNRAHIKLLRLAALVSVGCNIFSPQIELDHAQWARDLIVFDIMRLLKRFERGDVGVENHETKQLEKAKIACLQYLNTEFKKLQSYLQSNGEDLHKARVIPVVYLHRKLAPTSAFRLDRMGATNAIKRTIQNLTDADILREVPPQDALKRFATTQKLFIVSNFHALKPD